MEKGTLLSLGSIAVPSESAEKFQTPKTSKVTRVVHRVVLIPLNSLGRIVCLFSFFN